jgi:hypothetical protein
MTNFIIWQLGVGLKPLGLHFYWFALHLEYQQLEMPQQTNAVLVTMFWTADYRETQLQSLNRCCCLAHKAIFLFDLATACGQFFDLTFLRPPDTRDRTAPPSLFIFPNERLSRTDWQLWADFWASFTGHGGVLNNPLGEWLPQSHRLWEWHYHEYTGMLYQRGGKYNLGIHLNFNKDKSMIVPKVLPQTRRQPNTRQMGSCQQLVVQGNVVCRKSVSTPLSPPVLKLLTFWEFLKSLGGEWMWDYIHEGEIDVTWISMALSTGTFIGVTDGSYNRARAGAVSGSGWIICSMQQDSFFEVHFTNPRTTLARTGITVRSCCATHVNSCWGQTLPASHSGWKDLLQ